MLHGIFLEAGSDNVYVYFQVGDWNPRRAVGVPLTDPFGFRGDLTQTRGGGLPPPQRP